MDPMCRTVQRTVLHATADAVGASFRLPEDHNRVEFSIQGAALTTGTVDLRRIEEAEDTPDRELVCVRATHVLNAGDTVSEVHQCAPGAVWQVRVRGFGGGGNLTVVARSWREGGCP